jgi:hypothetical protein
MMRRFFARRDDTSATARAATRRPRRRRPGLEALEHRTLLSFAGSLRQVSALYGDSDAPANASSPNGTSVAVWINSTPKTSPHVYAQRFDAQGDPSGPVIIVDDLKGYANETAVAMDASGRFVVAWQDFPGSNGASAIEMRAFSSAGVPLTGVTRVATATTGTVFFPSVAASDGSFVIAYDRTSATGGQVLAQRYTYASGVPVGHGTFVVAPGVQGVGDPSVAMLPDGRFDVVYDYSSGPNNADIGLARYTAAGAFAGTSHVTVDTNLEYGPSVSMDYSANAVVAYTEKFSDGSYGVFANRVTAAGAVGPLIRVAYSGLTIVNYSQPSVALSPGNGSFVVAYNDVYGNGIQVEGIAADNTLLTYYYLAGQDGVGHESGASVSIDEYNRFLLTYAARPGTNSEVYSHRGLLPAAMPQPVSTTPGANSQARNANSAGGTSVVVWVDNRSTTEYDIYAQRFDAQGRPAGPPIAVDGPGAYSFTPAVAMDASGRFVVAWEDYNLATGHSTIEMRAYSAAGAPLTPITRVSTGAAVSDGAPTVAASNGSFVVAYQHYNGTNEDVLARRYTYASGIPVAQPTFAVAATAQQEGSPSVAMSPDGRFDIAYAYLAGPGDDDIALARYTATGAFAGTSYINTDLNNEYSPSVSMDNAGNAVVAYTEKVGSLFFSPTGVFASRVSAAGVVGPRITVAYGGGNYWAPSVALSPTTGAFVVAFETNVFNDITGFVQGVYAVEFSAGDAPLEPLSRAIGSPDDGSGVSVSIDAHGRYLVTFAKRNGTTDEVDSLRDFLAT